MMKAVAALALFESVSAFQAPLAAKSVRAAPQMFSEGDIGVLPPLGVYDPLGLIETRDMRRYEIMEIKHGAQRTRTCMHLYGAHFYGARGYIPSCHFGERCLLVC